MDIRTVDDVVRILQAHPEWRERIREVLLSDEERQTPGRLHQVQDTLEHLVESHQQAIARLDRLEFLHQKSVEIASSLVSAFRQYRDESAKWYSYMLEIRFHQIAPAILGYYVRRPRVVDLGALLDDLRESGQEFTQEEWRDLAAIDTLLSARHPATGEPIHVAVEVSWMIFPEDIQRISRRAQELTQRGVKTLPVVTGEGITPDARDLAQQEKVLILLDGSADVLESSWLRRVE